MDTCRVAEPSLRQRVDPLRVLLVEDDSRLAGLLEELPTGQGFAVEIARDGQAGLHAGLTCKFDVMVIDRGLPAIEGLDLVARLRAKGVFTRC